MYVSMIQQHSWNDQTKNGSFKENAKNPEKSATIKLTPTEAGEFLSSFYTRIPYVAFHRRENDTTIIKLTPWDKARKIKDQNGETSFDTPAFGLNVSKNSSQTFKLPLEAGETQVLAELLKSYIQQSFIVANNQDQQDYTKKEYPKKEYIKKEYPKKEEKSQESNYDLEEDVPF